MASREPENLPPPRAGEPSPQAAPCRVLVVTNMWPTSADAGYGSFVKDQVDSLRPLGVESDVLFINGRESLWNYVRAVPELSRRLRGKSYDLAHAHFGLSGCIGRFQLRTPLVVSFHGDDVLGRPTADGRITAVGRVFQASSFLVARSAAAVIVQSDPMRQKLRLPAAEVIPCGIDLNLFQPRSQDWARSQLGLSPEKRYVLFPYNPGEARKRFDLIEEASRRAQRDVPELEVLVVRGKPHHQMPLYMNAADVLVMASMIEGSPVAVKEAMACDLPVITVRVGDAAELVGGTAGCYVVDREAEPIADAIVKVCRASTRTNGREAVRHLSMENIARRIYGVYARVLGRNR